MLYTWKLIKNKFRFADIQVHHTYHTTREKSPVVFLCPEGGGLS